VALWVYAWTFFACGRARARHHIKAPATTGDPEFERAFRVQQNTVEQLVLFLPSLWLFGSTVSPFWGGIIGLLWSVGRVIYGVLYVRNPDSRGHGFAISGLATLILLIGGTYGVLRPLLTGSV
jgi:uncharacterized membrane protein YecN with MAPEG domain